MRRISVCRLERAASAGALPSFRLRADRKVLRKFGEAHSLERALRARLALRLRHA